MNQNEQHLSEQTLIPALPELFTDKRDEKFLILNPQGPWWFLGNQIHVDFLRLCDGKRSILDIYKLLVKETEGLAVNDLIQLAETLLSINFFAIGRNQPIHQCSTVHFYVTNRCNLECPFCFNDSSPSGRNGQHFELSADDWIDLACKVAEINPNAAISVSGGEPLLRKDIREIINGISQNNLSIRLITNGTLCDEAMAQFLSKIPRLKVQVSIDSLLSEENEKTRGTGSLDKALAAVLRMIDAGINVRITSTVTRINLKNTWRMKNFCDQHNIGFGTSFFFAAGDRSQGNSKLLGLEPGEILESMYENEKHFSGKNPDNIIPKPGIRRIHCGIGCGQLSIHPDGMVSPCRLLLDSSFYLGNVKDTKLEQLLEIGCKKFNFVGVDTMTCGCDICPVRYLCVGGCKAIAFYRNNNLNSLPPNCSLLKKIYIESLWCSVMVISE
jgi:radical SAM protein with 4Fe4S-binding SPASM domain